MQNAPNNSEPLIDRAGVNHHSWTFSAPSRWKWKRLKYLCGINPSRSSLPDVSPETSVSFLPMDLAQEHSPKFRADVRPYSEVCNGFVPFQNGDVLIAKITPCFQNGKGGIGQDLVGGVGFGSTEFHVLRPSPEVSAEFLYYATICRPFRDVGVTQMQGSAGQQRVPVDYLADFVLPFPPPDEQAAIVRFLDYVDRRIRRYIRAKRRLIALLNEQKQALIHRAVTRGLDPNVRLKSSGVEWLGDVPEGWEIRRNGRLFVQRNETGFGDLPILEVSLRTGVRIRDFDNSDRKQMMSDREKYKRAVAGDIAYNMMRMWQGAVGVAPVDGLISPAYVVAKPLPGTDSRYYVRLFRTREYKKEVDRCSRGIVKDRNRLYWEDFKRMPSCYPPPQEQIAIANAIDCQCKRIDTSKAHVESEIKLINEYRTRLIADVVTGKLDVREAAARLPDEDDEPDPVDDVPSNDDSVELAEADSEGEEVSE